ncbi:tRNA 2-selenouridine(34) synthase MnmH [Bacillus aquiflavi]|uniref:tRNA 2-selenouridine(34) synthase MnmH n=1 Tax=Bacillus aquiflavi TaxID=2672567 RepID=A0A6B3W4Q2_9BACI|nr:tRNA 2-selenouridine(34) synthase MnmH [Bacillus aquiflavi]MBA4537159.1 tRNA 2-selenouridine(34) synthase MnmH [Bacillus aquiflavi]NEY82434.1 tRNA 2-selenouridine(34) synthase MnmH [Bacillus aquiflavi]UAC49781.1 tRNA 2-selenouridine(34) synthase MnmH [Bacillus aquiflavi]
MHELTIDEFLTKNNLILVDVRSPVEFNEGSLPNAVNIPLFTDAERKIIGTIYKQEDERKAKWKAMEFVSPKIPIMLSEIKKIVDEQKEPIFYCWRGGMRSKAVATFADYAGLPSKRLIGGYRAYRKYILERIPKMLPNKAVVLHGGTGVGKTEILHRLEAKGYPVLDLEKIANHRGSVFGAIGQGQGNNQKTFDALLFEQLKSLENSRYFLVEAESKRIGRAIQPDELLLRIKNGFHLQINAPLNVRKERILSEYTIPFKHEPWYKSNIKEALSHIEKRMKRKEVKSLLQQSLELERYDQIVEQLLLEYYDPRYQYAQRNYEGEFVPINAESIEYAVNEIEAILKNF